MRQATGVSIQLHPPHMSPFIQSSPNMLKTRPAPERQEPDIPRLATGDQPSVSAGSDKMMHGIVRWWWFDMPVLKLGRNVAKSLT
jgi:hypothetical protein